MTQKLVKIKDSKGLHREVESRAILNTSSDDYYKYIKRRNAFKQQHERLDQIEEDVTEIKSMLRELLNNK